MTQKLSEELLLDSFLLGLSDAIPEVFLPERRIFLYIKELVRKISDPNTELYEALKEQVWLARQAMDLHQYINLWYNKLREHQNELMTSAGKEVRRTAETRGLGKRPTNAAVDAEILVENGKIRETKSILAALEILLDYTEGVTKLCSMRDDVVRERSVNYRKGIEDEKQAI